MNQAWLGAASAVVGGAITAFASWLIFLGDRSRRKRDAAAALRRDLSTDLVRALADLREWRSAPNLNSERAMQVASTARVALLLFFSNLNLPQQGGVHEWTHRVYEHLSESDTDWLAPSAFQNSVALPLLRWGVSDPTWPDDYFSAYLSSNPLNNFKPGDVMPDQARLHMAETFRKNNPFRPRGRRTGRSQQ